MTTIRDTKYYDQVSSFYSDDRYPRVNKGLTHYLFNTRRDYFRSILSKLQNGEYKNHGIKNVIEVACGDGVMSKEISSLMPEAQIVSNDISPGMVENAKKRNLPNVRVYLRGEEPELQYDLAVYLGVFNSMNIEYELDYVSGHLKKGGVFVVSFTHKSSSIYFYRPCTNPDMHLLPIKEYEKKFLEKFEILDIFAHTYFVPYLWKLPFANFLQNFIEFIILMVSKRPFHEQIYVLRLR